jgi:glyoxylase-like metal-dependent hydrolase (beta-lactamase superfamily II)
MDEDAETVTPARIGPVLRHHGSRRGTGYAAWTVVVEGSDVLLVDSGFPDDADALVASIAAAGRTVDDVVAVLVTHAHVDHVGGLSALPPHVPVLTSQGEAAHLRREFVEQVTPGAIAARAWRPRVARWAVGVLRAGGLRDVRDTRAVGVDTGERLDLPGRPIAVPTPGHTSGHVAWHFPDDGVVASGDALVTAHPTSRLTGPQLLEEMFHHDPVAAEASLAVFRSLDADRLFPGHGPPVRWPAAP